MSSGNRIFNRGRQASSAKLTTRLRNWTAGRLQAVAQVLASVNVKVDDSPGWTEFRARPNDRPYSELAQLYQNALEATRKNPLAKAIVDITTDFVLGDGIQISANHTRLQRFLKNFWNHPQNRITQRLPSMVDELTRAGDLFVALFRNPADGMSYLRIIPKEQIVTIRTDDNDWEREIEYHQLTETPGKTKIWYSPDAPQAEESPAVMLHYHINRPIGASFGEGDLDTIIPWLKRYSRMLEDRVRLHWSVRAFLWFVTVPTNKVKAKQSEYATPPEAGSIVVKDDAEEWEVKSPNLRANDARWDLQAARHMIDAVGYPPHWRGEGGDANLATAKSMQLRPERHLRRRQQFVVFMLQDLIYRSYLRAVEIGKESGVPRTPFHELFNAQLSDISREDNESLAIAANQFASALGGLFQYIDPAKSNTLTHLALKLLFKFAGEPQDEDTLGAVMAEIGQPISKFKGLDGDHAVATPVGAGIHGNGACT